MSVPSPGIAYLLIVHSQPNHLKRIIRRLAHPDDHFFVLVDKKQHAAPFQQALSGLKNITILPQTTSIYWVGMGTVEAELALFRAAFHRGPFAHYVLMSGADYPIKPMPYIRQFLLSAGKNFIPVHSRLHPGGEAHFTSRFTRYHFLNNDYLNPRGAYRNHRFFRQVRRLLEKYPIPRRMTRSRTIYHGPTWVSLTHSFVDYVLKTVSRQPNELAFYRHTYCPDEMFLHSLIKESPFATSNYYDFERETDGKNWLGLFYADWHTPDVVLPKTLDTADFNALKESHPHALFARKFDEKASAGLLDRIDEYLLV